MKKDVKTNRYTPTPHESSVNTPGNFHPTIPKGSHPLSDYIAESYVKYSEKKKKSALRSRAWVTKKRIRPQITISLIMGTLMFLKLHVLRFSRSTFALNQKIVA